MLDILLFDESDSHQRLTRRRANNSFLYEPEIVFRELAAWPVRQAPLSVCLLSEEARADSELKNYFTTPF
tara:strand:- start:41 stop:250 length:210 start_codon:yes stop_codon:yes gene_type:complete